MKIIINGILTLWLIVLSNVGGDCLQSDLEKFNGFYSSIEMDGGTLSKNNIPIEILKFKNQKIESISLDYLNKVKDGYLITFKVQYIDAGTLVIATLNSEYCITDFQIYPQYIRGQGNNQDTISRAWYNSNSVTIEIMNLNTEQEPNFKADGLWKEKLTITEDLTFKLIEKISR
jgi:hypothetical protein